MILEPFCHTKPGIAEVLCIGTARHLGLVTVVVLDIYIAQSQILIGKWIPHPNIFIGKSNPSHPQIVCEIWTHTHFGIFQSLYEMCINVF